MPRRWVLIKKDVEYECVFHSVNSFKGIIWLSIDKKKFKVTFLNKTAYFDAKLGEIVYADASNKLHTKSIKIVFK